MIALFPWPATLGVWVAGALLFGVWWLVIAARMETADHADAANLLASPGRLQLLLEDEANSEPGL